MQCLIEELQSQVLPSPEPHKIEGEKRNIIIYCYHFFSLRTDKISSPYMSTLNPSPSPDPSPEPSPVQPIVVSSYIVTITEPWVVLSDIDTGYCNGKMLVSCLIL